MHLYVDVRALNSMDLVVDPNEPNKPSQSNDPKFVLASVPNDSKENTLGSIWAPIEEAIGSALVGLAHDWAHIWHLLGSLFLEDLSSNDEFHSDWQSDPSDDPFPISTIVERSTDLHQRKLEISQCLRILHPNELGQLRRPTELNDWRRYPETRTTAAEQGCVRAADNLLSHCSEQESLGHLNSLQTSILPDATTQCLCGGRANDVSTIIPGDTFIAPSRSPRPSFVEATPARTLLAEGVLPAAANLGSTQHEAIRMASERGSDRSSSVAGSDRLSSVAGSDRLNSVAGGDHIQRAFFKAYFVANLTSPKLAHRIVVYQEEEAIHSYTEFLKELDNEQSKMEFHHILNFEREGREGVRKDVVWVERDCSIGFVSTRLAMERASDRNYLHVDAAHKPGCRCVTDTPPTTVLETSHSRNRSSPICSIDDQRHQSLPPVDEPSEPLPLERSDAASEFIDVAGRCWSGPFFATFIPNFFLSH
ncbi:ubiquinol oxidase [Striga asiatica]|uniref:Ubiquinol oxidase n=1 Tax=Striga asiatica TaxID=4170 RepID=A0A5A7PI77_STRAF|nr:ubiquinol oxidase [Striga asiatica]